MNGGMRWFRTNLFLMPFLSVWLNVSMDNRTWVQNILPFSEQDVCKTSAKFFRHTLVSVQFLESTHFLLLLIQKGCLHQLQSNSDFAPSSACLHKSQLEVGGGTLASSTWHSLDSDIGPLGGTWLQSGRESELTRRVTEEESCLLSSWTNVILSQTTDKWVSQTWDSNFFQTLQTVRAICPYERYLLMES